MDNEKPLNGKGNCRRRLRKKYQLVESDDEGLSPKKNMANGGPAVPVFEIDDEDNFPIFSCLKNQNAKKSKQDVQENADKGTDDVSNKKAEDDGNYNTESKRNTDDTAVSGWPIRYKFYLARNCGNLTYDMYYQLIILTKQEPYQTLGESYCCY